MSNTPVKADEGKAQKVIKTITDIITIVFPAAIAIVSAIGLKNSAEVISVMDMIEKISLIVLGSASSIASIIYNFVNK